MNEPTVEFDDLINMGAMSREVKIGAHTITLKTLNYNTFTDMVTGVEKGKSAMDMQVFVLANSISKIDGKDVSMEAKERLLKSAQMGLVNLLTSEYEKMLEEQGKLYDEVKKNTSQTLTKTP
jgi:hypothetical protein